MKFFLLVKLYFQRTFVFRLNFVMSSVSTLLSFLFTIMFWYCAMQNSSSIQYSIKTMIIYFFIVMLIGLCIQTDVTNKVSWEIYSGNLSSEILKPVSYNMLNLAQTMSTKVILFFVLTALSAVLFFIPDYSSFFSLSVLISLIINYEMCYLIGLLAFWTNTVWGITMINSVFMNVFGGKFFPISIAGDTFQFVCKLLPYQYIYYVPTQILEYKLEPKVILVQIFYMVFLYYLTNIVYKLGTKRFEATGM